MKIVIPGGSGQVGQVLARAFQRGGHDVVVLSRSPTPTSEQRWRVLPWDAKSLGAWADDIDGCNVVINLAGRSVNCRYNAANQKLIMDSRIDSTRVVGQAIAKAAHPPGVWLQASTATIYAHRFDAPNDETTGILGGNEPDAPAKWRFSIDVAKAWEAAANEASTPNTRMVLMRSAMTMSPDPGGIFDVMATLARRGLGGRAADGRQYIFWIHEVDFVRSVYRLIEDAHFAGPVNLASPNPLPNAEFMADLRAAVGAKFGLPATRLMLEVGAIAMRTETELVLKSRRVVPGLLLQQGFTFEFPDWATAANELAERWKRA